MKRSTPPLPYQGRVPRRSSGDEAALHIRRMIFDGELRPGERVPQDEVAAALGISRIPVREALIALEREGWVTIELHRGAFINALDEGTVRDNYELFGVTYGFAARRALDRGVDDLLPRLKEIQTGLDATDDPAEFTTLAFAFHAAVVDAAQSPRLRVVLRAMSALVPGDFFVAVPDAVPGQRRGLTAIHRALKRADAEAAADEYLKTMRRVGELLPRLKEIQTGLDATDDPAEFTTLAFAFHAAVVDAAQSPRLRVVLRAMSALVPGDFFVAVPDAVAGQRRGLTAIHRALKRGDAEAAADEYLKTMRRVGEHVVAVFRARGLFDTTGSAA